MGPLDIATDLTRFHSRGPGSDAERRAARHLQRVVRDAGREASLETEWVRPHWPAVHALHAILGVIGSVVASQRPGIGLAILATVLLAALGDLTGRLHALRRLTSSRATQNVVSRDPRFAERPFRLIVTAAYDAGHGGLAYGDRPRRLAGRLRRAARGRGPGPFGWMVAALTMLCAIAVVRLSGTDAGWLSIAQLVPTVVLLAGLALLVDVGLSPIVAGANDPASGAAVAIALVAALDAAPPSELAVELVLAGAGEGRALGMRGFVRRRRRYEAERTIVLCVAASGAGRPCWWTSDGLVFPLRFHPRLRELAAQLASSNPELGARPHRGRGMTGGYPPRVARWPAITIGALDADGRAPRSHRRDDVAGALDPTAMQATLELGVALVGALDADLAARA